MSAGPTEDSGIMCAQQGYGSEPGQRPHHSRAAGQLKCPILRAVKQPAGDRSSCRFRGPHQALGSDHGVRNLRSGGIRLLHRLRRHGAHHGRGPGQQAGLVAVRRRRRRHHAVRRRPPRSCRARLCGRRRRGPADRRRAWLEHRPWLVHARTRSYSRSLSKARRFINFNTRTPS